MVDRHQKKGEEEWTQERGTSTARCSSDSCIASLSTLCGEWCCCLQYHTPHRGRSRQAGGGSMEIYCEKQQPKNTVWIPIIPTGSTYVSFVLLSCTNLMHRSWVKNLLNGDCNSCSSDCISSMDCPHVLYCASNIYLHPTGCVNRCPA
jgi:hypothetical protein